METVTSPGKLISQEIMDREKKYVLQNYGRYPLALERQYEANWQPVVLPDGQGNSLYELLTRAGVPPRYPRPQPVSTRRLQLATALALAVALAIGVSLHQLLWPRARWF